MVSALFVKLKTINHKPYWRYEGQADSEADVAKFVREVEQDIIKTKSLVTSTVSYKVVELDK